ncbi:MAG: hypothetical protein JXA67_15435 [Micromonosporaceae bacterium]|nr:hypothetical protein [Micromonosporaceae bacterium]
MPTTVSSAAATLADLTGQPVDRCAAAIRTTLLDGARVANPDTGRPVFAFRLHQFLSKDDQIHVSLEAPGTRHITSRYQTVVPGEPDKILVPLAFCRECGQEYLVVSRTERAGQAATRPAAPASPSPRRRRVGHAERDSGPRPGAPTSTDHWK